MGITREEVIAYGKDYYRDLITACCEIDEKHKEFVRMSLKALEQEPCEDCISRQAVLSMQYRIDDSATLSMRDVVNVDDIEDLPPVTPQVKCEDIAKAFQLGMAMGFAEKYNSMDRVIEELKKTIATPQESEG